MTTEEKKQFEILNENTKTILIKLSSIIVSVGDITNKIACHEKIENMRDMIMENLCAEVEQLKKHFEDLEKETEIISRTLDEYER